LGDWGGRPPRPPSKYADALDNSFPFRNLSVFDYHMITSDSKCQRPVGYSFQFSVAIYGCVLKAAYKARASVSLAAVALVVGRVMTSPERVSYGRFGLNVISSLTTLTAETRRWTRNKTEQQQRAAFY